MVEARVEAPEQSESFQCTCTATIVVRVMAVVV